MTDLEKKFADFPKWKSANKMKNNLWHCSGNGPFWSLAAFEIDEILHGMVKTDDCQFLFDSAIVYSIATCEITQLNETYYESLCRAILNWY